MSTSPTSEDASAGPIYFWRDFEEPYGFLSQWYEHPFEVEGVTYRTAEMWMMVQKAKLFGDEESADQMMQATVPSEHQALGRQVKAFNGEKWNQNKSRIVEEGNYHKFTKGNDGGLLQRKLLETGERELVEASPADRVWGVGYRAADAGKNRSKWGENRLGKAIMLVRQRLREEGR